MSHIKQIKYSYVLNNPLKYTDPSGYVYRYSRIEENVAWHDGAQFYYDMMDFTARFSGGGGGGGYGSRISAMGRNNPAGWHHNNSTGEYWNGRTGERMNASDGDAMSKMGVRHQVLWTTDENGDLQYVNRDEKGRGYYTVTGEYTSGKMVDVPIDFNGKAYIMRMQDVGIYRKKVYLRSKLDYWWNTHWTSKIIPDVVYLNTSIGYNAGKGTSVTNGFAFVIRGKQKGKLYTYSVLNDQRGLRGGISLNGGYSIYYGDSKYFNFEEMMEKNASGWEADGILFGVSSIVTEQNSLGGFLHTIELGGGPSFGISTYSSPEEGIVLYPTF